MWWFVGVFTAGWSSARFGWRRVRSSAAVSTEPPPARFSSGESGLRPGIRRAVRQRAPSPGGRWSGDHARVVRVRPPLGKSIR